MLFAPCSIKYWPVRVAQMKAIELCDQDVVLLISPRRALCPSILNGKLCIVKVMNLSHTETVQNNQQHFNLHMHHSMKYHGLGLPRHTIYLYLPSRLEWRRCTQCYVDLDSYTTTDVRNNLTPINASWRFITTQRKKEHTHTKIP